METYNSQEFVEYLNEIRHIRRDSDDALDDDHPLEEGEEEWEWLKEVGFDSLVSVSEPASEVTEQWNILGTLPQHHVAAVNRRVTTLRDTLNRRRSKDKGRRPDMRHLFPSEATSTDSRSRSATPDSLDSLSPPLTPPEAYWRLQAGSPHSQGYHSSSRGSLDRLEPAADGEKESRAADYRHVLRIPLDQESREPAAADEPPVQLRRKGHETVDRAPKASSLFETTSGNYKLNRFSEPADASSGIQAVSFHPIGSVRRRLERAGELGELHIPRPQTGARADARKGSAGDKARPTAGGRLGRTFVDFLSEPDVKRLQKLAMLELTALFDEHGLSYSRRKARRRRLRARPSVADSAVFGCSLATLLERDRQRQPDGAGGVSLLLERVLTHLERRGLGEEGLLRVPGHQQKVEQLRRDVDECFYNQPGAVDAALQRSGANDVAALVKLFLRELPAPLLTRELMDAFHRSDALPADRQLQALALLCLQLPAPNRAVLRRLLQFLAAVAAHEASNKMSLENVAMIMAPNLLWPAHRRQKDISVEIEYASVTSRVVRNLIRHRDRLWEVPDDFVRQLRGQYEAEGNRKEPSRPMKKLLRKKDAPVARKIDSEVEPHDGTIRVTAPQFSKSGWPVVLTPETTAGDVVTRILQQVLMLPDLANRVQGRREARGRPNEESTGGATCLRAGNLADALQRHFLHEQGGNIGQRRIEHDAVMLECYQENPGARWVIHCCHASDKASSVEIVAE
ncbi:rho GTPase-activating protein conundrum-like isoform X2 [Pollicipes pollicipes]|nr:rho GTPase-activating protein conundrum-like isoform X2 [Pollicipes pollicipes]